MTTSSYSRFNRSYRETNYDLIANADKNISDNEVLKRFDLVENRDWQILKARQYSKIPKIEQCLYRPFDFRYMLYGEFAFDYLRPEINNHLLKENFALITTKQTIENYSAFISNVPLGQHKIATPYDSSYVFPLYIYPETKGQENLFQEVKRTPNLNPDILKQITEGVGLKFTPEKESTEGTYAPIDVLDYIYAVLHSPEYRETYKEFLKIDFPRVPYPKDAATFWQLVKLGGELRQIHLLESPIVEKYITQYPIDGTNTVTKPHYQEGKVYINDSQYFDNVPEIAWNFYIGGYQPAQKWLKDRRERTLEFEDILHYQKIIVALFETDRIMKALPTAESF